MDDLKAFSAAFGTRWEGPVDLASSLALRAFLAHPPLYSTAKRLTATRGLPSFLPFLFRSGSAALFHIAGINPEPPRITIYGHITLDSTPSRYHPRGPGRRGRSRQRQPHYRRDKRAPQGRPRQSLARLGQRCGGLSWPGWQGGACSDRQPSSQLRGVRQGCSAL
jgi:hypothetical protein